MAKLHGNVKTKTFIGTNSRVDRRTAEEIEKDEEDQEKALQEMKGKGRTRKQAQVPVTTFLVLTAQQGTAKTPVVIDEHDEFSKELEQVNFDY